MFATILYAVVFGGMKSRAFSWRILTFELGVASGGNFSRRSGMRSLSSSIAVTLFAMRASSSVRMPRPGPISMT